MLCKKPSSEAAAPPFLVTMVAIVVLVLLPGCSRWKSSVERVNPALTHQFRSLSLWGPRQASIVENSRELLPTLRWRSPLKLTDNGGKTWRVVSAAGLADAFECATMISGQRGWAVNHQGQVFTTDSGGTTWTKISDLGDFTCASQIQFVSETEGWIRECLSIWSTRDGGATWEKKFSVADPGVDGQPSGMALLDANTVIVSGSSGQLYSTKDGGGTWKIVSPLEGENIDFDDVWFVDAKRGWVVGYQVLVAGESLRPLLFETTDGGDSWKQVFVDADILPSSVCFVGNDGWLAGSRRIVNGDSVGLEGVLLRTTDGGTNWQTVELGPNEPFLTDVRFADRDHGWVVGRDTLYRTEDGGTTWKRVLSLPPLA